MEDIAKQLALHRADKNLTQADVAKALGVTQQTIANWESGKPIRGNRAMQLRLYLGGHDHDQVEPVKLPQTGFLPKSVEKFREAAREQDKDFVESLPEGLRGFVEGKVKYHGVTWACDYMSGNVCAELKVVRQDRWLNFLDHNIMNGLFNLATLRAIQAKEPGELRESYLLVLIGPHPANQQGYLRMLSAAAAHNIMVAIVPDAMAAAAFIADLEYGPLE